LSLRALGSVKPSCGTLYAFGVIDFVRLTRVRLSQPGGSLQFSAVCVLLVVVLRSTSISYQYSWQSPPRGGSGAAPDVILRRFPVSSPTWRPLGGCACRSIAISMRRARRRSRTAGLRRPVAGRTPADAAIQNVMSWQQPAPAIS